MKEDLSNMSTDEKIDMIIGKLNKFENLVEKVNEINNQFQVINGNISGLADEINSLENRVKNIELANEKSKKSVDYLLNTDTKNSKSMANQEKTLRSLDNSIATARAELNNLEQYGRRTMVVVNGIPFTENENTDELINTLNEKLGTGITKDKIDISHRTKQNGIIVKFCDRKSRNTFYAARKGLKEKSMSTKDLGFDEEKFVYVNESLTQINGDLFRTARNKLQKTSKCKYVWTVNGITKAQRSESSETYTLKTLEAINKLAFELKPMKNP